MDWNRIEGDWKQAKGKIKEKWGKLTDDDLAQVNGNTTRGRWRTISPTGICNQRRATLR